MSSGPDNNNKVANLLWKILFSVLGMLVVVIGWFTAWAATSFNSRLSDVEHLIQKVSEDEVGIKSDVRHDEELLKELREYNRRQGGSSYHMPPKAEDKANKSQ